MSSFSKAVEDRTSSCWRGPAECTSLLLCVLVCSLRTRTLRTGVTLNAEPEGLLTAKCPEFHVPGTDERPPAVFDFTAARRLKGLTIM